VSKANDTAREDAGPTFFGTLGPACVCNDTNSLQRSRAIKQISWGYISDCHCGIRERVPQWLSGIVGYF